MMPKPQVGDQYQDKKKTVTVLKVDVTQQATFIETDKGSYGSKAFESQFQRVDG